MRGMLKVEGFRFLNSRSLLAIIGVLVACAGISIVTGTYNSAELALFSMRGDSMLLMLSAAVYSALLLTDDFTNGMIRQYIASGHKRPSIITAKLIHYLGGCTILLLLYPLIPVSLAAIVQGVESSFLPLLQAMIEDFLKILPLYWGIASLYFFIAILVQKGAAAMGISVAVSIIITVFTNNLYGGSQPSASSLVKFSPVIQIQAVTKSTAIASEYVLSVVLSLGLLVLFGLLSIVKFNHDEL